MLLRQQRRSRVFRINLHLHQLSSSHRANDVQRLQDLRLFRRLVFATAGFRENSQNLSRIAKNAQIWILSPTLTNFRETSKILSSTDLFISNQHDYSRKRRQQTKCVALHPTFFTCCTRFTMRNKMMSNSSTIFFIFAHFQHCAAFVSTCMYICTIHIFYPAGKPHHTTNSPARLNSHQNEETRATKPNPARRRSLCRIQHLLGTFDLVFVTFNRASLQQ